MSKLSILSGTIEVLGEFIIKKGGNEHQYIRFLDDKGEAISDHRGIKADIIIN